MFFIDRTRTLEGENFGPLALVRIIYVFAIKMALLNVAVGSAIAGEQNRFSCKPCLATIR